VLTVLYIVLTVLYIVLTVLYIVLSANTNSSTTTASTTGI
jgi:hypothetical protein